MIHQIVKWLPFLGVLFKLFKFIFNWLVSNGLVATSVATGIAGTALGVSSQAQLVEQSRELEAFNNQIEIIEQTGSDNTEELQRQIARTARELADDLRVVAGELTGDLQSKFIEASDNLENEAQRLDDGILVTTEELNETITGTKEALDLIDTENRDALDAQLDELSDIVGVRLTNLEGFSAVVPPIGSLTWIVDTSLVDPNHYQPCDGTDINGSVLPNINSQGLFIRGGTFTGAVIQDSTAVNGLGLALTPDHTHWIAGSGSTQIGGARKVHVPTSNTGDPHGYNTEPSGSHNHAISGDSETAPIHTIATCYVRVR